MLETLGVVWNEIFLRPMVNSLVLLYILLFQNYGLAIIVFTGIVRLVTLPLTLRQIRQTRAMSGIQPKLKELQEKFAKDKQRMSKETLSLYRQSGVNPIGCLGPMVIQMPIWIGLFQAIRHTLSSGPDAIVTLSEKFYFWLPVDAAVPLSNQFLYLNLAEPDVFVLPLLVGVSTWVQQKMMTVPTADPKQSSTNNIMLWMMPVMLAVFSLSFPSGLALYWFASNVIGVIIQYFITGWQPLFARRAQVNLPGKVVESVQLPEIVNQQEVNDGEEINGRPDDDTEEDGDEHGNERGIRKDNRRSGRGSNKGVRRKKRRG